MRRSRNTKGVFGGLVIVMATLFMALVPQFYGGVSRAADSHVQRSASRLAVGGPFVLTATQIDATNAHLRLLPDVLHPSLLFSDVAIQDLQISSPIGGNLSLTIRDAQASGTGIEIKTSVFSDLKTALGSFVDKADLLVLLVGGTVKHLKMTNVYLTVDRFINSDTMSLPGLQILFAPTPAVRILPKVTVTPTPSVTPTPGPTSTPTPGPTRTATPGPTATSTPAPTPTATPPPKKCSWPWIWPFCKH